jgi:hypothetical protein
MSSFQGDKARTLQGALQNLLEGQILGHVIWGLHIGNVAGKNLVASAPDVQGPLDHAHGVVKKLFSDRELAHD